MLLSFQSLFCCSFNKNQSRESISKTTINDSNYFVIVDSVLNNTKVRIAASSDSLFINIDNKKNNFLWGGKRDLPKERLTGLFFIDNKKILKKGFFFKNNLMLFTIFDDLYRGELFILNLENGSLVKNKTSETIFLNSDEGPYIIDKKTNRIITISMTLVSGDAEVMNRKVAIYSFNDKEINYEGGFEITKIDELTDEDYISVFNKYKHGFKEK